MAKIWHELTDETKSAAEIHPAKLVELLIKIGCRDNGAYVIGGLIRQLDSRFTDTPAQKAEVARGFLDVANCPGAQALSEENRAKLRQMRGPASPELSSGTASR